VNLTVLKNKFNSYQERWRDVPDEARQPTRIFLGKVPIHTKLNRFGR
jgi:hypothetical protein